MDFFSREAGQARRNALADSLNELAYFVPPELRPWLGIANELNPFVSMERAGTNALAATDPNATGWQRVQAVGDMASNMAGAVSSIVGASRGAVPAAQAVEDALMGWSASSPMAFAARDFATDEFGGVKVWTGGIGDPIKAASDRGAWFAETPDLAREYAGQSGRVLSAEIDPRNPIAFRHAEQRRPIGDLISTALEGAGQGANFEAARPIVERLYQRYGAKPRALFEYWNNDKDVADLFRALGYDAISAAEKADMKAATWAALDPSIVKMDAASPSTLGFRAFHGSPHDFDRFSLDKIGTGEGAQAYGHGLYFAESEDVARAYRDQLTNRMPQHIEGNLIAKGISADLANTYARWAAETKGGRGSVDGFEAAMRAPTPSPTINAFRHKMLEEMPKLRAATEGLNGRMYEVQINADPNDFLDWDKPLSEQPAAVRDALGPRVDALRQAGAGIPQDPIGEALWRVAHPQGGFDKTDFSRSVPEQAAERLRSAGIPGIRYLDAGSRGAGDGSRNYVVFDDKLIEIIRKYGWAAAAPIFAASGLTVEEARAQYEGQM